MSFCVLITRRRLDSVPAEITLAEWQAVVHADQELTATEGEQCIRWNGPCSMRDPSLEWDQGEVFAHNPDTALLAKMRQLAGRLGARVITEEGDDVTEPSDAPFSPETAYDYDFDEYRRLTSVREFLLYHLPAVTAAGGLLLVLVGAVRYGIGWPGYIVACLAGGALLAHLYYQRQEAKANEFRDWLLRNVRGVVAGTARFHDTPITLDTRVTRFSAVYSFLLSESAWSRWYVVGKDDRRAKWLHCTISLLLGSWGVPLGPLETAMALMINLTKPGGDALSVRNLYLRNDDRLCTIVGRPD